MGGGSWVKGQLERVAPAHPLPAVLLPYRVADPLRLRAQARPVYRQRSGLGPARLRRHCGFQRLTGGSLSAGCVSHLLQAFGSASGSGRNHDRGQGFAARCRLTDHHTVWRRHPSPKVGFTRRVADMNTTDIEGMSITEGIQALERIWASLLKGDSDIESPNWHQEVLAGRRIRIDEAYAEFISLAELKAARR